MPGSGPRSSPVARVSRSALEANARTAWGRGIRSFAPSLLEADAWGHDRVLVHEVLDRQGFTRAQTAATSGAVLTGETLFGLPGGHGTPLPALRLTGTVLSVKDLRAGEGVSYGYAFRAPRDTRVALVTGGYAQGVVRALGGAVDVAVHAIRHPIVGRVAMDVCVVEVGDAAIHRGEEVLFLGDPAQDEPSLAAWVRATGLTPAELVTTVGLRATREVVP